MLLSQAERVIQASAVMVQETCNRTGYPLTKVIRNGLVLNTRLTNLVKCLYCIDHFFIPISVNPAQMLQIRAYAVRQSEAFDTVKISVNWRQFCAAGVKRREWKYEMFCTAVCGDGINIDSWITHGNGPDGDI